MTNEERYMKLEAAFQGLIGMALMAREPTKLGEYIETIDEALELIRDQWGIDS